MQEKIQPELAAAGMDYEILAREIPEDLENLPPGDFVLVLGGDGTFLAGALVASYRDIPVIGIEFGHLGFLCQLPFEMLPEVLESIRDARYHIESRPILKCTIESDGKEQRTYRAINDVVVGKSDLTRMVLVTVLIDDELLATFKADGIIVASATGSTAYSLSAGGPLLEPTMASMVITPICAHTLYAKPCVVDGRRKICLRIEQNDASTFVSMDGRKIARVRMSDSLCVTLHEHPLKVARVDRLGFFHVLREKFGWGFEFKRNKL